MLRSALQRHDLHLMGETDMTAARLSLLLFAALIGLAMVAAPVPAQDDCANLVKQKLGNVTIPSAVFMNDPQGFALPQTPGIFGTPAGQKTTAPFAKTLCNIGVLKFIFFRGCHGRQMAWRIG
jgi:hypothetical protein